MDLWHRYRISNSPDGAQLMLVVKSGNIGLTKIGPGIGGVDTPPIAIGTPPPANRPASTPHGEAEVSSTADDMLFLSIDVSHHPSTASSIWRRNAKNGLSGSVPLVAALKKSVEESEKAIADAKKP
jgi:hypothetical protein